MQLSQLCMSSAAARPVAARFIDLGLLVCIYADGTSACSGLAPSTSCIILLAAVDAFVGQQQHASLVAFMSNRCSQRS